MTKTENRKAKALPVSIRHSRFVILRRATVLFLAAGAGAGMAEPSYERQLEDVVRVKQRMIAALTLAGLPADSPDRQAHLRRLDEAADKLLAAPDDWWWRYRPAEEPPIFSNGAPWNDPRTLATVWATPCSRHHHQDAVLRSAGDGLRHLLSFAYPGCPQPGNWWAWQIGIPMHLLPTLLLLEGRLDEDLFDREVATLAYLLKVEGGVERTGPWSPSERPYRGKTDTNSLWHARLRLNLGILLENPALAGKWAERSFGEIAPAGAGHFQADGSFKFHGPIPMWAYGESFLVDYADLVTQYEGTAFGPTPEQLDLFAAMADTYVNGFFYRGRICPAIIGRTLTRGEAMHHTAYGPPGLLAMAVLAKTDASYGRRFAPIIARERAYHTGVTAWTGRLAMALSGVPEAEPAPPVQDTFAYPDSEFVQVTRPNWAVGIKMHSQRNRGYESINDENLQGWFLSHGSMFHFIRGDEWDGCWPTLDWTRLPGTTAAAEVKGPNESPFCGVIRGSKDAALAAMELRCGEFRARKSWLVAAGHIVCSGSGITGPGRLETTVFNQPVAAGAPLLMDGEPAPAGPFEQTRRVAWLWLDGVGYVFPGGQEVLLLRESRTSDWTSVRGASRHGQGEAVTHHYLTAVIPHGAEASAYCYIMAPDTRAETMPALAKKLAEAHAITTDEARHVVSREGEVEGVVLWEAGRAGPVATERGVMLLRTGGAWQVVDPCWNEGELHIRLEGKSHQLTPTRGRSARIE